MELIAPAFRESALQTLTFQKCLALEEQKAVSKIDCESGEVSAPFRKKPDCWFRLSYPTPILTLMNVASPRGGSAAMKKDAVSAVSTPSFFERPEKRR